MTSQNEKDELAARYLKFSLPGLIEAAVGACKGAKYCTSHASTLFICANVENRYKGAQMLGRLIQQGFHHDYE